MLIKIRMLKLIITKANKNTHYGSSTRLKKNQHFKEKPAMTYSN